MVQLAPSVIPRQEDTMQPTSQPMRRTQTEGQGVAQALVTGDVVVPGEVAEWLKAAVC